MCRLYIGGRAPPRDRGHAAMRVEEDARRGSVVGHSSSLSLSLSFLCALRSASSAANIPHDFEAVRKSDSEMARGRRPGDSPCRQPDSPPTSPTMKSSVCFDLWSATLDARRRCQHFVARGGPRTLGVPASRCLGLRLLRPLSGIACRRQLLEAWASAHQSSRVCSALAAHARQPVAAPMLAALRSLGDHPCVAPAVRRLVPRSVGSRKSVCGPLERLRWCTVGTRSLSRGRCFSSLRGLPRRSPGVGRCGPRCCGPRLIAGPG